MFYRLVNFFITLVVVLSPLLIPVGSIADISQTPPFVSPAVAYQPRGFVPGSEDPSKLSEELIREDLQLLKANGFRSLLTYSARGPLGAVPGIARQEGFDGVIIMGIWDPLSKEEWENALAQARFIDGYCVGNEGLGVRYNQDELADKMAKLRDLTGLPVTTSEPIDSYLKGPYQDWLLSNSDWLFPLAHPFWAAQSEPIDAVNWLTVRHDFLTASTGKRVVLKEAGLPSKGIEGMSEEVQLDFFKSLEATGMGFYYFEAFDQPWKAKSLGMEVEAHWGLYRADGTPKKVVPWLTKRWTKQ